MEGKVTPTFLDIYLENPSLQSPPKNALTSMSDVLDNSKLAHVMLS